MAKKKRKRKNLRQYEPLLIALSVFIAALLLVLLIFWVFQDDKKEEVVSVQANTEQEIMQNQQNTAEMNDKEVVLENDISSAGDESESEEAAETSEDSQIQNVQQPDQQTESVPQTAEQTPPPESAAAPDTESIDDAQDPQESTKTNQEAENGAVVDISTVKPADTETKDATLGIDVSKYQGNIDWAAVATAGVDFAIVRVGYRTTESGLITEDAGARYNLQEATKNGLKVGAYFFSTAVTETEAIEEANWVADFISKYKITYPVAFNCEGFNSPQSRQYALSKEQRSALACAFLDTIAARGYTPMFYASRNEMENSAQWDMSRLGSRYKVWVSQYPDKPFPETPASAYSGVHAMWQYTSKGKVYGIKGNVDINVAYFGYSQEAQAKDQTPAEEVKANPETGIDFTEVNEQVTAKNETNLRSIPSTQESQVVHLLKNGEVVQRTGIGSNGWDRLIWNGQTVYAVHQYLITDLTPQQSGGSSQSQQSQKTDVVEGMTFTAVAEAVTARDKVNLRDKPSTETGNVVGVLSYGEAVVRTGISGSADTGWSRLEVNGQVVYASSRLLATSMDYKNQEKPTAENPEAGFHFTEASGNVKAKDVTNLRTLPTTNEPSQVAAQLSGGATAVRIAADKDKGWTKVNYNGQILYAVSNYLVDAQ